MNRNDIEKLEIDLLLIAIFERYGYDFTNYARASLERRVLQFLSRSGCDTISAMIPKLMHNESFFADLVRQFSITVTEMFRDPQVYRALRQKVVPLLRSFPFIKIWVAGCATGEEAYSMAIMLREEGLAEKATIYATDFNDDALEQAQKGIFSLRQVKAYTSNYQKAGGAGSFSRYYHARYGAAVIEQTVKNQITFANHNLVTDRVFSEMHLILCRNVMIYFNKTLQNRVLELFRASLSRRGYLCLGQKESLAFSSVDKCFESIDDHYKIFRIIPMAQDGGQALGDIAEKDS